MPTPPPPDLWLAGLAAIIAISTFGLFFESSFAQTDITITLTDTITDDTSIYIGEPQDITSFVINNKTYVAVASSTEDGVQIIDVSDPNNITATSSITGDTAPELDGPFKLSLFDINGKTYLAVASITDSGVQILDVSNPNSIVAADSVDATTDSLSLNTPYGIDTFVANGKTYAAVVASTASYLGAVQIIDITDPNNITGAGSITDDQTVLLGFPISITTFVIDGKTYAIVGDSLRNAVQIIDVTTPSNITVAGALTNDYGTLAINEPANISTFVTNDKTYAAISSDVSGVQIIDVSDPNNITAADSIVDDSTLLLNSANDISVFVIYNKTYAAVTSDSEYGVQILDLTDPNEIVAVGSTDDISLTIDQANQITSFEISNKTYVAVTGTFYNTVHILEITAPKPPTPPSNIKEMQETMVSAKITGPNEITITYNKEIATFINSYLNFTISGEDKPRNITGITGSPSIATGNTILVGNTEIKTYSTTLVFDGKPAPSGSTGSMYIQHAEHYLAKIQVEDGQE
ncbi:MAG: hypothetical protein OXC46_02170 [Thaumarchaeota archaeon]|nr:hypothetical protein [Nitrososphaerota archaeon]